MLGLGLGVQASCEMSCTGKAPAVLELMEGGTLRVAEQESADTSCPSPTALAGPFHDL